MIFVNDLAGMKDVPGWMKHYPADGDGMTFVDVVFPAFLFIVGMAIPFALRRRLERGDSAVRLGRHILLRTLGLLVIGVFMVNMGGLNPEATGMSRALWTFLVFVSVILVWNAYPKSSERRRWIFHGLRAAGAAGLMLLAALYRGGAGEQLHWMRTSWWGILGLIGWAYLTSCIAYLLFRRQMAAMMGVLGLLILLYVGDKSGAFDWLPFIRQYLWLGGQIGGHSSITVAGIIVSMLFFEHSPAPSPGKRMVWILVFALGLFVAGYLLDPLYGINKNAATPAWCLYCSAICCGIYVFLYWLMDLQGITRWSFFVRPAGANPLLAYILPSIFYSFLSIVGIEYLRHHFNTGGVAIARSAVFALAIVGLTGLLGRLGVRLRL